MQGHAAVPIESPQIDLLDLPAARTEQVQEIEASRDGHADHRGPARPMSGRAALHQLVPFSHRLNGQRAMSRLVEHLDFANLAIDVLV